VKYELLSQEIGSKLTGRNISFEVFPLSFAEFLRFHILENSTGLEYLNRKSVVRKLFAEYLQYALQKMGRYEEALVACDKELQLKPNDIMVLTNKGQILSALGRRDDAEAIYNKAVHLGYKNNTKAEEQLAQLSV
jgi:tetratricopeptide (TPR) repeat protein